MHELLVGLVKLTRAASACDYMPDDIGGIRLQASQATALAVVVNELVSNALKDGSPPVELRATADGPDVRIEVLDNGSGFPAGFDASAEAHIGLEIVERLVHTDLGGQARYGNYTGGGHVSVTFPASC